MKKIAALYLVIISLSCDNESTIQPQTNTVIPVVNDYWPTEIGNEWNYNNPTYPNSGSSTLYKVIGPETINGNLYYKFHPLGDQNPDYIVGGNLYVRKNNGDYYYKIGETLFHDAGVPTGSIGSYEFIILKDYLEVNNTWSGSYTYDEIDLIGTNSYSNNVTFTAQILAKNVTEVINNVTYNNIIKVKLSNTFTNSLGTSNYALEFWFAKNIGIVKRVYINANNNAFTNNITSYLLN